MASIVVQAASVHESSRRQTSCLSPVLLSLLPLLLLILSTPFVFPSSVVVAEGAGDFRGQLGVWSQCGLDEFADARIGEQG